jgi:hypothetical protein
MRYPLRTHRISPIPAPSDAIIAGAAVFTMLVSSRMRKLPRHSTSSAAQGGR